MDISVGSHSESRLKLWCDCMAKLSLSRDFFDLGLLVGNFTTEQQLPDFTEREYAIQGDEVQTASKNSGTRNTSRANVSAPNPAPNDSKSYIGFLIAILSAIILCLAAAIVLIVLKSQKIRSALTSDNEKVSVLAPATIHVFSRYRGTC